MSGRPEEYVRNEAYVYPQLESPSEMTPLVSGSSDSKNHKNMSEEYVRTEQYAHPQVVSPSEMTPLVSGSSDFRNRVKTASVSSWEKVGSGDDEFDNEVRRLQVFTMRKTSPTVW